MDIGEIFERKVPVIMTIGGSDSSGGAGIQADLKVFNAFRCYGTSVITCITAQNPDEILAIEPLSAKLIKQQMDAVLKSFDVNVFKTGMLYSAEIVDVVAGTLKDNGIPDLVVDPVMFSSSGTRLLQEDGVEFMIEHLLPLATLITPNVPEAEFLSETKIDSVESMGDAAEIIGTRFDTECVVKGGHLDEYDSDEVVDVLYSQDELYEFRCERLDIDDVHGTGCTFASAAACGMAHWLDAPQLVRNAQLYVASAISNHVLIGSQPALNVREVQESYPEQC
jgi:hydroxymethylpyrimidine/phosphomethylpyrimidine kinase